MKHSFLTTFCLFLLFIGRFSFHAQICDKKTSFYFDKNQSNLQAAEQQKLDKFVKVFAQKTDTFMLELHAFSDSIASVAYNHNLSSQRLQTVLSYIKNHSSARFKIVEKVRGEALPPESNATEEGRAKNRRVDVFYWKVNNGRITLKGKGNLELDLEPEYFGSCGVCESNPKLQEIYTNDQAERAGIPLTTTDGRELITSGMMKFDFSCQDKEERFKKRKGPCPEIVIRIPAGNYDSGYEIWRSTPERTRSALRWYTDPDGILEYDAKNKCYVLRVMYCPGQDMVNLDKLRGLPSNRETVSSAISGSLGAIALPELSRSRKGTYVESSEPAVVLGYGKPDKNLWRFRYLKTGPLFFVDSGQAKNKIGYMFSGSIDRYEAYCDTPACVTEKQCWCFELPIDAYAKIIYFKKNKEHRLKMPWRYRSYNPKLFIPAADTLLPMEKISRRKYKFQQPLPDTYVVVYSRQADAANKRAYDAHISLEEVKTKHKRSRNYYKAKLKSRQIQKAIRSNS